VKPGEPDRGLNHFRSMLALADANETFEKFSELPPELRVRIYELYFRSYDVLDQPVQPPSKASTALRTETLPVFYRVCKFRMDLTESQGRPKSKNVFYNIPAECLGRIRKLLLIGTVYHGGLETRVEWQVEIGRPETYKRRSVDLIGAAENKVNRSFTLVTEFLQSVDSREGKLRLTRDDLDGVVEVLRQGREEEKELYSI
jgi:hypothetical protein